MTATPLLRTTSRPRVHADGARFQLAAAAAAARYEFRMQIRRRSLWLVLGLIGVYLLQALASGQLRVTRDAAYETAAWAWILQVLMPIAIGVLLADRLVRDRRLKIDELLDVTPPALTARYLGKFAGATAATLMPMLLVYALGLAWLAARGLDPSTVAATAVPAFVLIDLPGLLFIAAFSFATPLIMPVPVYQFLYVGYWFWGNLIPPQIMPTLRDTWLTPIGWMIGRGLFGLFEDSPGPIPSQADAVVSIAVLLAGAAAALVAGLVVLRFQRSRR